MTVLRSAREAAGFSRGELAEHLGVQPASIALWERGQDAVPSAKRLLLARLLQRSPDELDALVDATCQHWHEHRDLRLATALVAWREQQERTLSDVADATDVPNALVHAWESGHALPDPTQLAALATLLRTTADALLTDAGFTDEEVRAELDRADPALSMVAVLLRSARDAAGLRAAELAAAARLDEAEVHALEAGAHLPSEVVLARLRDALDLDERDLEVALDQARRAAGEVPRVVLSWPLDPARMSRVRWIRQLRAHLGLSLRELAARVGVAPEVLEDPREPLVLALRRRAPLAALAELGVTTTAQLRRCWQPDAVAGIEDLIELEGAALVAAAPSAQALLRVLVATGTTQSAIAEVCGVSREAVRRWVTGLNPPGAGRLDGLAAMLGVAPAALAQLSSAAGTHSTHR